MIREYLITALVLMFGLGMYQLGRIDERDDTRQAIEIAASSMDAASKAMGRCIKTLEGVATWMN